MFPCLMARNEIPRPLWGDWNSLTRFLSPPSSSASDLALLLVPRPSSLWGLSVPLPHHLLLRAVLPNVRLPSVPRTSARRHFLGPVDRPAVDVSLQLAVGSSRGDHLVCSPAVDPHLPYARRDAPPRPLQQEGAFCVHRPPWTAGGRCGSSTWMSV